MIAATRTASRPRLLMLAPLSDDEWATLARHFDLIALDDVTSLAAILVDGALTNSREGFSTALLDRCPALRIVHFLGSGSDGIDHAAALRRGVAVTNAGAAHATSVAEHGLAMLLAMLRDLPRHDRVIRSGGWAPKPVPIDAAECRIGLLGYGNVGQALARMLDVLGVTPAYHARSPRADSALRYYATPIALAEWATVVIVTLPGDDSTRHLVDATFLAALGTEGYLINIGRGSVVDTAALIEALTDGTIAGAALDVLEKEPEVPTPLRQLDTVFLTAHVGGTSMLARRRLIDAAIAALTTHFAMSKG